MQQATKEKKQRQNMNLSRKATKQTTRQKKKQQHHKNEKENHKGTLVKGNIISRKRQTRAIILRTKNTYEGG